MSSGRNMQADKARCGAATPGPWTVLQRGCHELGYDIEGPEPGVRGMFARKEDAEFGAEARAALPYYLDRDETARAFIKEFAPPFYPCPGCPDVPGCREVPCLDKIRHDKVDAYLKEGEPNGHS